MSEPTGTDPIREALQARLGGQYAIEGLLGQGGMGSVYRARDITLDRAVAIKVISGDVATNPQLRDRFLLEARTVAKLRHPNIVAVYAAGDAGGLLYFVMELVPGESLRDLLTREQKVEPARAERILHELALALDYAHSNGIVHRDVKPENILLDRETGRAMLTDFGVARALEGDGRMTGTGMILGSPRYMSPEQASGDATIDGRSDLYSLALVGYEMFTGKPVVDASNVAGMLVKHLTETPKPLADAVVSVPEGVATAIDRALAKDRAQRWANGREMADVIGMAWTPAGGMSGSGMRTAVGGLGALGSPGRTAASKGRSMVIGGVAVAALAATAWAMFGGSGVPRGVDPRRSYAVMPFEVQSGNADIKWLRDGAVNMLTLALAQWKDLDVADYERTMVLVRDAGLEEKRVDIDKALEIARRANVWTVVTGTITTTSDSLRVDARLYDVASGRSLQTESRSVGLGTDPRPLFDGLARYLIGVAGVTGTESVDLAAATTNSLVAYRAYLEGVRALFSWQMRRADSLFDVAVRNDSSFALAWHKRSLALGWGDASSPGYLESSARALALVDRLPAREQALVRGHHALSRGLRTSTTGGDGRAELKEAQGIYRTLIESDPGVAEAWYGYGDALFHETFDPTDLNASTGRMTASMRAFERTLALDSTFHLAYSHLIQQYQMVTGQNGVLLVGDSIQIVADSADLKRLGGAAGIAALRDTAIARGFRATRGWVRADPDAVPAAAMLANGYIQAGQTDSALAFLDRALQRPALANSSLRFMAGIYQMVADDPRGVESLLQATRTLSPEAMRREVPEGDRFSILASTVTAAAMSGSSTEINRTVDYFVRTDSVVPFGNVPTRPLLEGYRIGLTGAVRGSLSTEERKQLLAGLTRASASPSGAMQQMRQGMLPLAYAAFMLTGDTAFASIVKAASPPNIGQPDLEARLALSRGDTAAARRIALTFSPADSVKRARLGLAGLRTVARAEVLEALGDKRGAIAQYEAMHPSRFNTTFIDPGFAVYVRTFAARARLYEQVGERDKAIAAWQEFLRRWEKGDSITEPARAEARAALQRLRDSAPRR
ncbi:MAG: protein kinase domain-containing protein [Gemmatimonadaceae bacterium]